MRFLLVCCLSCYFEWVVDCVCGDDALMWLLVFVCLIVYCLLGFVAIRFFLFCICLVFVFELVVVLYLCWLQLNLDG